MLSHICSRICNNWTILKNTFMNRRILIAADIHTHPVLGGNQQCIMQYVKVLRKLGFEVYFLYIDLSEGNFFNKETQAYWGDHLFYYATPKWQTILQKVRRRIEHCYYSPHLDVYYPYGLTSFVNCLHEEYHFHGLIVNYVWNSRLSECNIPIKCIYTHDVFTNRNEKLGVKDAWYSYPQSEEAKGIARFAHVLSIQEEESEWFRKIAPQSEVHTVYSSFDFVEQPITCNKNILFFSGGGALNKAGIDRFITEVLPMLIKQDNDIRLLLGGGICSCYKQEDLDSHIILKGRYENPDDFYVLGDICINPVFNGSGLKIKTFEALAHGKVTIVDPHSALGVYQPNNIPLHRALSASDYLTTIIKYIQNKELLLKKRQVCKSYINDYNNYIIGVYRSVFFR